MSATPENSTGSPDKEPSVKNLRSWRKKALSFNRNFTSALAQRRVGTPTEHVDQQALAGNTAETDLSSQKENNNSSARKAAKTGLKSQSGSLVEQTNCSSFSRDLGTTSSVANPAAGAYCSMPPSIVATLTPALRMSDVTTDDQTSSSMVTPRSAVCVSFERRAPDPSEGASEPVNTTAKKKSSSKKRSSHKHQTPLQKTLTCTSYRDLIIRPLICEDYNASFLRFVTRIGCAGYARTLTNSKFRTILLERKRTNHYTLVAICPEDKTYMAIGSIIILQSIFSDVETLGYIDNIFVDPQYAGGGLEDRMAQRLLEIAELVPTTVSMEIIFRENNAPSAALLAAVASTSRVGEAYSFKIKKI